MYQVPVLRAAAPIYEIQRGKESLKVPFVLSSGKTGMW